MDESNNCNKVDWTGNYEMVSDSEVFGKCNFTFQLKQEGIKISGVGFQVSQPCKKNNWIFLKYLLIMFIQLMQD